MGPKEFFTAVWKIMFPKKEKIVERQGVIGHYDSKPFHNFHYALIYANETMVYDDGKVEVFFRVYKDTTMINVLVNVVEYVPLSELSLSKWQSKKETMSFSAVALTV